MAYILLKRGVSKTSKCGQSHCRNDDAQQKRRRRQRRQSLFKNPTPHPRQPSTCHTRKTPSPPLTHDDRDTPPFHPRPKSPAKNKSFRNQGSRATTRSCHQKELDPSLSADPKHWVQMQQDGVPHLLSCQRMPNRTAQNVPWLSRHPSQDQ